eukprot:SAG31_NODE_4492_length_3188_cov_3.281716_4_plen_81_part_00
MSRTKRGRQLNTRLYISDFSGVVTDMALGRDYKMLDSDAQHHLPKVRPPCVRPGAIAGAQIEQPPKILVDLQVAVLLVRN